jgi:uncharacterized membrane protein
MDPQAILVIIVRWIHVVSACLVVGGIFFLRVILPLGLRQISDENTRNDAHARILRAVKMISHTCMLLFIATGTYNAMRLFKGDYTYHPGVLHGMFGVHAILALVLFGVLIWALKGPQPKPSLSKALTTALVLSLLTVAIASTLKWARERAVASRIAPTTQQIIEIPQVSP